ncbi:hypothetical protein [Lentzea sp.]|uniref:hypothetical protein n=1 Tax=Lentzea sp. TaxID=56099 RepID=UPI002ED105EA
MTHAQGDQFPPATLDLNGTTWTRSNPHSTTSAVYQCPAHPSFHITLILKTPLKSTNCTQVHATPNQHAFRNLHVWLGGADNFHAGAEHFTDLTKPQQNNAYTWFLANGTTIQALLDSAYSRLRAAKTAFFPPAQVAANAGPAPQKQATAWDAAQQNAEKAAVQHAAEEQKLQRKLGQVRRSLNYVSLNFPDAELHGDKAFHFVCDYAKWSAPLGEAVVVWAPPLNEAPQSKFKFLLEKYEVSELFFLYGALTGKGRVACAVPRSSCTKIELGGAGTSVVLREVVRQKKKLDHVVANVIEPYGYAPGHVFLPFIGGLVKKAGWYSYDPAGVHDIALHTAIEFKLDTNKLPNCLVQVFPNSAQSCALDLMRHVHATDLTKAHTGFMSYPWPDKAVNAWVQTLPEAEHKNDVVLVDGLFFALKVHLVTPEAKIAYSTFGAPAYFLRSSSKPAFFDLNGLTPLDQPAWKTDPVKILQQEFDEARDVTPSYAFRCMLDDAYVLETPDGVCLSTHLLRERETPDDVAVTDGGTSIGWVDLGLTYPLMDHLLVSGLVTTGSRKIAEFASHGTTWWKVDVEAAEYWVCTADLQQVVPFGDKDHDFLPNDELQILDWVIAADGDGLVFVQDGKGTWLARMSVLSTEAPDGHT